MFESINEPQFADVTDEQGDQLNSALTTEFVQPVRATGGGNATRLLVLPTLHTSGDQVRIDALNATITARQDPNIAATVHFYGYWPFSTDIAGGTSYDSNAESDLFGTFDRRRLADPRRLVRPADRGGGFRHHRLLRHPHPVQGRRAVRRDSWR